MRILGGFAIFDVPCHHRPMKLRLTGLLWALVFAGLLSAAEPVSDRSMTGLEFAARELSLVAKPDDTVVEAVFSFVNRSDRNVVIDLVKPSCGCTAPSLEKTSYEPGEEGKIKVIFTVGGRQGPQHLSINVRTNAGEQPLTLLVDVPRRVEIMPRLLLFNRESNGPQIVGLTYHVGTPVEIQEARNLPPGYTVDVREIEKGSKFEVSFTHTGTGTVTETSSYEVRSRDAFGREHSDRIFLRSTY